MKPSEWLKTYDNKEIRAIKTLDEWIILLSKELDKRFIDKEEILQKIESKIKETKEFKSGRFLNSPVDVLEDLKKEIEK